MATIIAYIATLTAVALTITSIPQMIVGGLLGRFLGPLMGGLLGSILTWLAIDWLWLTFEGGHIPIAALAAAMAVLFVHGYVSREELTEQSNWMMAAELWAIVLVGVGLCVMPANIRWY